MLRRFICWLGFHNWYSGAYATEYYYNKDDSLKMYQVFLYCECCLKTKVATIELNRPTYKDNLILLKTEKENEDG